MEYLFGTDIYGNDFTVINRSSIDRLSIPVPEIIDPVFAKTSQNARFLLSENERFGLVFVKTGSINSGTGLLLRLKNDYAFRGRGWGF